jgi:hypothetical protein
MLLEWKNAADEIVNKITSRPGFLKIVLKTKDDEFFVKDWIEHHARIVGLENLIIADNESQSEYVLDLYRSYGTDLLCFSFSGNHNLIHSVAHYEKLYEAIACSAQLRLFLDTDERLVWIEPDRWYDGEEVLDRIKNSPTDGVVPTALLSNLLGSSTDFHVLSEFHKKSAWLWGKAIVPRAADAKFIKRKHIERLHNCQFEQNEFSSRFNANIAILHFLNLDKQQRLKINKQKLVNFGLARADETYEALAARDGDYGPPTRFIQEIRTLLKWDGKSACHKVLPESAIRLLPSHQLEFANDERKFEFEDFVANGDSQIRAILGLSSHGRSRSSNLDLEATVIHGPNSLSLKPHMTDAEFALLSKNLDGAKSMLEFGCGGSTVLAGFHGVAKIVSVDSDQEWLDKVVEAPELTSANFLPIHVDIGPTGPWGFPTDKGHALKWPNYYTSAWSHFSDAPDLVLIDGRFRVACALYSMMKCSAKTKYVIHDFWNREYYHGVLEFLECVERADSLAVFVAKDAVDWQKLAQVLIAHAHDFQ